MCDVESVVEVRRSDEIQQLVFRIIDLERKLRVASIALERIKKESYRPGDLFCHPEGCDSPGIAKIALEDING